MTPQALCLRRLRYAPAASANNDGATCRSALQRAIELGRNDQLPTLPATTAAMAGVSATTTTTLAYPFTWLVFGLDQFGQ